MKYLEEFTNIKILEFNPLSLVKYNGALTRLEQLIIHFLHLFQMHWHGMMMIRCGFSTNCCSFFDGKLKVHFLVLFNKCILTISWLLRGFQLQVFNIPRMKHSLRERINVLQLIRKWLFPNTKQVNVRNNFFSKSAYQSFKIHIF